MPTVTLNSEQKVVVPKAVKDSLAAAGIESVAIAAQVADSDREPALVLIAGDELVLVGRRGAQRWPLEQIEQVGRPRILLQGGEEVPISSWWYTGQARQFRTVLRERVGQPRDEADVAPVAETVVVPEPVNTDGLAQFVAVLGGIVVFAICVSSVSWTAHLAREGVIGLSAFFSALIGLPLLICSVKLARVDSRWRGLGVAGVVLGLFATLLLGLGILLLIAISRCDGNCIGG